MPLFRYFLLAIISQVAFSQVPLYTIPRSATDWTYVTPTAIQCPFNHIDPGSGCAQGSGTTTVTATVMSDTHSVDLTVNGFTCTGLRMIVSTYTSFFGAITVEHRNEHYTPDPTSCKQMRSKLESEPSVYDDQLALPVYDNSWLKTVETKREGLIIHPDIRVKIDPYTLRLASPLFPAGLCTMEANHHRCFTIHSETLWFSDEGEQEGCHPFSSVSVSIHKLNNVPCGVKDHHNYDRSLNGSCKIRVCGLEGLRFKDGFWMTPIPEQVTAPNCPPGITVLSPTQSYYEKEEEISHIRRVLRDNCLDALEDLSVHGHISSRRMGYFRPLNPGPGKAYRILNGSIQESQVVYQAITKWSDLLPNSTCLLMSGACFEDPDGVYFNGIQYKERDGFIIPERDLATQLYADEILMQHSISLEHPVVRSVSDYINTPTENGYTIKYPHGRGWYNLGFSAYGDTLFTIFLVIGIPVILFLIAKCACSAYIRKKFSKDQTAQRPSIVVLNDLGPSRVKSGRSKPNKKAITWEDYQVESRM